VLWQIFAVLEVVWNECRAPVARAYCHVVLGARHENGLELEELYRKRGEALEADVVDEEGGGFGHRGAENEDDRDRPLEELLDDGERACGNGYAEKHVEDLKVEELAQHSRVDERVCVRALPLSKHSKEVGELVHKERQYQRGEKAFYHALTKRVLAHVCADKRERLCIYTYICLHIMYVYR